MTIEAAEDQLKNAKSFKTELLADVKAANLQIQKVRDKIANNMNTMANQNGYLKHQIDDYNMTCMPLQLDRLTAKIDVDIELWTNHLERMKTVSKQVE